MREWGLLQSRGCKLEKQSPFKISRSMYQALRRETGIWPRIELQTNLRTVYTKIVPTETLGKYALQSVLLFRRLASKSIDVVLPNADVRCGSPETESLRPSVKKTVPES